MNLACNSATISQGLLGPQGRGGEIVPAAARRRCSGPRTRRRSSSASAPTTWTGRPWCASARSPRRCNDKATTAYFQQQLASFSKNYLQLLSQLADAAQPPAGDHQPLLQPVRPAAGLPEPGRPDPGQAAHAHLTAGHPERGAGQGGRRVRLHLGQAGLRRAPAVHARSPTCRAWATRRRSTPRPSGSWLSRWPTRRALSPHHPARSSRPWQTPSPAPTAPTGNGTSPGATRPPAPRPR